MIDILVRPEARRLLPPGARRRLGVRLRAALRVLGRPRAQAALLLACDQEVRALNRDFRQLDRATDVLSFPQLELAGVPDPAGAGVFLGDIVISVETARRRSGRSRLPGELARLAIHGLCHLLGHDHHRPGPAEKMRRLELNLMRRTRQAIRNRPPAKAKVKAEGKAKGKAKVKVKAEAEGRASRRGRPRPMAGRGRYRTRAQPGAWAPTRAGCPWWPCLR